MLVGSFRSNSSKKKRKRAYYYRLSHEKPKKSASRKRQSPEPSLEIEADEQTLPSTSSTTDTHPTDLSRSFVDARPRTRSMSQTMELPPLLSHPEPHLLFRQKVPLDPSYFTPPIASPSLSPGVDSTSQQQLSEEPDNTPQRLTRQRVREEHMPAIPEKEPFALPILVGTKNCQSNDSKSDDLENHYQSGDFHHLDLVWAKSVGYPSYPAIVSYLELWALLYLFSIR